MTATRTALVSHLKFDILNMMLKAGCSHENGQYIWMRLRGRAVRNDNDGRAIRMVGYYVDVSKSQSQ